MSLELFVVYQASPTLDRAVHAALGTLGVSFIAEGDALDSVSTKRFSPP